MRRTCVVCGKTFLSKVGSAKYCSPECNRKRNPYTDTKPQMKEHVVKKPKLSVREVAVLAREEGLTYGQYVSKYGI